MDGILNVNKPSGPTSHDIVNAIRGITGTKRVGHAGTLDPLASGVLVVFVGKATRMIEYMTGEPKVYTAGIVLGRSTDTCDITGQTLEEKPAGGIGISELKDAVKEFRGVIEQVPPMYSAIKSAGKPLYKIAREGKSIPRAARRVNIFAIDILDFVGGEQASAVLRISCSSGTYIRTLCEDIGRQLGVPACMGCLVRNAVGSYRLEEAWELDKLEMLSSQNRIGEALLPVSDALRELPVIEFDGLESAALCRGNTVEYDGQLATGVVVRINNDAGKLLGVGVVLRENGRTFIKPEKILV